MTVKEIREKLHTIIETAEEKKLKAIYTILETGDPTHDFNFWNSKDFRAELQRREADFLNANSKTYSIKESTARAKKAVKAIKHK